MDIIDNIIIISTTPEKDKHLYGLGLESGVTLIPQNMRMLNSPLEIFSCLSKMANGGLVNLDGAILLQPEYDNIFSWNKDDVVVAEGQPFHYKVWCC